MDIPQLVAVLQGGLSPDREQRSAAEALLKQHETARGQLVNLLRVAAEPSVDLGVRQAASISFKQTAKRHWEPDDGARLLADEDKAAIRASLLDALISSPHIIQSQLQEVLASVAYSDHPHAWPGLLEGVMAHLQSNDQARMYGGLVALRVLARKYEFKDDEERAPLDVIIAASFPVLLPLLQQLLAAPAVGSGKEVPEFIKLICKVFWSCTFMHIPQQLLAPDQFQGWMLALHTAMRKQLPWDQAPPDAASRAKWPWAKALKWVLHNTYRLFNRYGEPRLCSDPNDVAFAKLFEEHVSAQFLEDQLALLAGGGGQLSPRVVHLALQHVTRALELKGAYKLIKPHVQGLLSAVVLPQLCWDDDDAALWEEDPQEFVRKGYDVLEDMMNPRTAAANFITTLAQARPKGHLPWLMGQVGEVMGAYAAAAKASPNGAGPPALARQLDGALLAVGALGDTLKRKEPYRSQLEAMLGSHVVPLFGSPHAHLRAKAAWLAKEFADIEFGDASLFNALLQAVINSLSDGELPVRVEGAMALRCFIDQLDDVAPLTPILPQLMEAVFRLMGEVENEDLVFTLEAMVEKFGDAIAPYAVNLAQNLAAAFWKYSGMADAAGEDGDGDDDDGDTAAVAAYGCLKALNTLLDAVAELKHLLPALEEVCFPIMAKCISSDGQDVLEDVLELLAYFTYFGELTPRLWSLWPQLHSVALDFGVDYWDSLLIPLDNFVSRGTAVYLGQAAAAASGPSGPPAINYQESLFAMVSHTIGAPGDDYDELNMLPAVKLLCVVLQHCPGQVDPWLGPYLQLGCARLAKAEGRLLRDQLLLLVANALYYNAGASLALLAQAGGPDAVQQLFGLWFGAIFERRKRGSTKPAHFRSQAAKKQAALGLLALLGNAPDEALPPALAAGLPQLLAGLVRLLTDLKEQQAAAAARGSDDDSDEPDADDGDSDDAAAAGGGGSDDEEAAEEALTAEDAAYMARLRKAALRMLKGETGEDDDDSDDWSDEDDDAHAAGSPLDELDPFCSLTEVLVGLQAHRPARYAALMAGAEPGVLAALQELHGHAAAAAETLQQQGSAGGAR